MTLVIDNCDSFTRHLVHYPMELRAEVEVVRNNAQPALQPLMMGEALSVSGEAGFIQ